MRRGAISCEIQAILHPDHSGGWRAGGDTGQSSTVLIICQRRGDGGTHCVERKRLLTITVDVSSPLNQAGYSPTLRDMLWPLLSGTVQV